MRRTGALPLSAGAGPIGIVLAVSGFSVDGALATARTRPSATIALGADGIQLCRSQEPRGAKGGLPVKCLTTPLAVIPLGKFIRPLAVVGVEKEEQ